MTGVTTYLFGFTRDDIQNASEPTVVTLLVRTATLLLPIGNRHSVLQVLHVGGTNILEGLYVSIDNICNIIS